MYLVSVSLSPPSSLIVVAVLLAVEGLIVVLPPPIPLPKPSRSLPRLTLNSAEGGGLTRSRSGSAIVSGAPGFDEPERLEPERELAEPEYMLGTEGEVLRKPPPKGLSCGMLLEAPIAERRARANWPEPYGESEPEAGSPGDRRGLRLPSDETEFECCNEGEPIPR